MGTIACPTPAARRPGVIVTKREVLEIVVECPLLEFLVDDRTPHDLPSTEQTTRCGPITDQVEALQFVDRQGLLQALGLARGPNAAFVRCTHWSICSTRWPKRWSPIQRPFATTARRWATPVPIVFTYRAITASQLGRADEAQAAVRRLREVDPATSPGRAQTRFRAESDNVVCRELLRVAGISE